MEERIEQIRTRIETLRQQIINHKVYRLIQNIDDLQIFMQYHVYAVWDFMSLLKSLQVNLTCASVPWFPKGSADTRYLINEIVTGEECDVDSFGNRISHYELYLQAMAQCGANTAGIQQFTKLLQHSGNFETAFAAASTPLPVRNFVNVTFNVIGTNKPHIQAAVFTFGREDLIPGMFLSIINDIHQNFPGSIDIFKYYLERHIEVDGGHHSHLALQMTTELCGNNDVFWQEAGQAVEQSLRQRIALWDGASEAIKQNKAL